MPNTSLDNLCDCIRPRIEKLIELAEENFNWDMRIVNTLRTPAEQAINLAKGVSWTSKSKHLAQPFCNKSHAADIAPEHLMILKNWAPEHSDWLKLGQLGESANLKWGGRWAGIFHRVEDPTSKSPDCPHFDVAIIHTADYRITNSN